MSNSNGYSQLFWHSAPSRREEELDCAWRGESFSTPIVFPHRDYPILKRDYITRSIWTTWQYWPAQSLTRFITSTRDNLVKADYTRTLLNRSSSVKRPYSVYKLAWLVRGASVCRYVYGSIEPSCFALPPLSAI